MVTILAAIQACDNGIGFGLELLFRISEDMKRLKTLTVGNVVIMGRITYESLPLRVRPLPDRTNIVITSDLDYRHKVAKGVIVVHSLLDALAEARKISENIYILGGGRVYKEAMGKNVVDRLELTVVESNFEANVFFPAEWKNFGKTIKETKGFDELSKLDYSYLTIDKAT